jgi:hypothetical protein
MRKALLVGVAALSVLSALTAHAEPIANERSVQWLYHLCKDYSSTTAQEVCEGYIDGSTQIMQMNCEIVRYRVPADDPLMLGTSNAWAYGEAGARKRAFIDWVEKNPQHRDQPLTKGLWEAFGEKWPCEPRRGK